MSGLSCSFLAIFSSKYCLGVVGASAMAVSRLVGATEWSFIQRRRGLAAPPPGVNHSPPYLAAGCFLANCISVRRVARGLVGVPVVRGGFPAGPARPPPAPGV